MNVRGGMGEWICEKDWESDGGRKEGRKEHLEKRGSGMGKEGGEMQ